MKTREQIYGQEAAGILRDVSMYRALTEMQLLKLYPHKESKIRNLLSYLQKQGRIVQCGEYYRIPAEVEESIDHGLSKAVWVLTDFMEQVEYHSVSDYPAKIIFFADGEVYEIIYAEPGKEQLRAAVSVRLPFHNRCSSRTLPRHCGNRRRCSFPEYPPY